MKQSNKAWPSTLGGIWCGAAIFVVHIFYATIAGAAASTTAPVASAGTEQDLLEPERAFVLSARFKDAKTAEFLFKIADGYYMYGARFKVFAEPKTSAKLGKPVFTKGEMKQDATFGRVEIYRNSMRILIPASSTGKGLSAGGEKLLRLKVTSQGCADVGVCYPPLHQTLTLQFGSGDIKYPDFPSGVASDLHPTQTESAAVKPSLSEILRKTK